MASEPSRSSARVEADTAEQPSATLAAVDALLDDLTASLVALTDELHQVGKRVEELEGIRGALRRELARAGYARDQAAGKRDTNAANRDRRADARDSAADPDMPATERTVRADASEDRAAARSDRIASSEDRAAAREREGRRDRH